MTLTFSWTLVGPEIPSGSFPSLFWVRGRKSWITNGVENYLAQIRGFRGVTAEAILMGIVLLFFFLSKILVFLLFLYFKFVVEYCVIYIHTDTKPWKYMSILNGSIIQWNTGQYLKLCSIVWAVLELEIKDKQFMKLI